MVHFTFRHRAHDGDSLQCRHLLVRALVTHNQCWQPAGRARVQRSPHSLTCRSEVTDCESAVVAGLMGALNLGAYSYTRVCQDGVLAHCPGGVQVRRDSCARVLEK